MKLTSQRGAYSTCGAARVQSSVVEEERTVILKALVEIMEGTAAQKLSLFETLKAAGMLSREDLAQVELSEKSLRVMAAVEKATIPGDVPRNLIASTSKFQC